MSTEQITIAELADLKKYESVIEKGKQSFVEVGSALMNIRDGKLYRKDHKTFEDYCQSRWGFNRHRGSQLISAAIAVQQLPADLVTIVTNEGQARALAKVPRKKRAKVIKAAAKNGHVTAASVAKAAAAQAPKTILLDQATGYPVPEEIAELWENLEPINKMLSDLSDVKVALMAAQSSKDNRYSEVNFSDALASLATVRNNLKRVIPYAVCPGCQGKLRAYCQICKGRGAISKFLWDSPVVTKTLKQLREKLSK